MLHAPPHTADLLPACPPPLPTLPYTVALPTLPYTLALLTPHPCLPYPCPPHPPAYPPTLPTLPYTVALLSFVLHLDHHLSALISTHGPVTYVILFAIVFCETGLVLTPFLPGDSLLFAAGAFAGGYGLGGGRGERQVTLRGGRGWQGGNRGWRAEGGGGQGGEL